MVLSLYEALLAVCFALLAGLEVLVAPCGPDLHRPLARFVRSSSESFRCLSWDAGLIGPGRSELEHLPFPSSFAVLLKGKGARLKRGPSSVTGFRRIHSYTNTDLGVDGLLTVPRPPCGGWYVSAFYRTAGLQRASEPPFEAPSHAK